MKAVILAGGLGTRLAEETSLRPKPMVEIGGRPILWHIMKSYSACEITEFVICCGYKGYVIKEYFANYFLHMSDVTFDMKKNSMEVHHKYVEPWRVTLINTGDASLTGGRLKRVRDYVLDETFCFTYGDGLSDVNFRELIEFHKEQRADVTLTAVQPPGRYGAVNLSEESFVRNFQEKPQGDNSWINGGFFVVEPRVLDLIESDRTSWEGDTLPLVAASGRLAAFKHSGFWQAMDTLREKNQLEDLWCSGNAPWKTWA